MNIIDNLDILIEVIEKEINYHKIIFRDSINSDQAKGFLSGLEHSKYLVEKVKERIQEDNVK